MIYPDLTAAETIRALRLDLMETRRAALIALADGDRKGFRRLRGEVIMLRRHLAELGMKFSSSGDLLEP
jgi:hypothetical protein